jgi:hypothetical protein
MHVSSLLLVAALAAQAFVASGYLHVATVNSPGQCDPKKSAESDCKSGGSRARAIQPSQLVGYNIFSEFIGTVQDKNYTGAAKLLSDQGNFVLSDVLCGELTKTQFLGAITSAKIASLQVILGEWVETMGDLSILRVELSVMFGPDHQSPYSTYNNPNVYVVVNTTPEGKQIFSIQLWTDSGRRQSNSSLMLDVFNTVVSASRLGNLRGWDNLLSKDFVFKIYQPFVDQPPVYGHNELFLAMLSEQYANQQSYSISVRSAYVTCTYVAADFSVFIVDKQGNTKVHKIFLTLRINHALQIYDYQQWYLGRL